MSKSTLRSHLLDKKLSGRVPLKKLCLRERHGWTLQNVIRNWNRVIWSHVMKIAIFAHAHHCYVCLKKGLFTLKSTWYNCQTGRCIIDVLVPFYCSWSRGSNENQWNQKFWVILLPEEGLRIETIPQDNAHKHTLESIEKYGQEQKI